MKLEKLLSRMMETKIFVCGDVMLDVYLSGEATRISPEAPVLVLEQQEERFQLGGAANVARNLASLGVHTRLTGIVGGDMDALVFQKEVKKAEIQDEIVEDTSRKTTRKTRVIAQRQQIVRIDLEDRHYPDPPAVEELIKRVHRAPDWCDALIFPDYGKGVLPEATIVAVMKVLKGVRPIYVDPKPRTFQYWGGATAMTPNWLEWNEVRLSTWGENQVGVQNSLGLDTLLVTCGERGMVHCEKKGKQIRHHDIEADAQEVFDVTGAGDTVIAVYAAARTAGAGSLDAAKLANRAAGIVVGRMGCGVVTPDELLAKGELE